MHRFMAPPWWAAWLALALHSAAFAQSPLLAAMGSRTLSLEAALALAEKHHPQIAAARHGLQASDGLLLQADRAPSAQLELLVEGTRADTRTTTLQLSQPLERGGKRAARVLAAQRGVDEATLAAAAARSDLRAEVQHAFHAVAISQERMRLTQASHALSMRAADAARRRVQAGRASPVEETRAAVAQAGARVEMVKAEGAWRAAGHRLASLVGWDASGAPPRVEGPGDAAKPLTPAPMPDAALLARVAQSTALAQARSRVAQQEASLAVARAQGTSDVTLTLGAQRLPEADRSQLVLGVAFALPMPDSNHGAVLAASRQLDQAEAESSAALLRLQAEAIDLNARLQGSEVEVQALRQEVLPGAESALQAMVTGFEMGKFSFLDVLDAQRTLHQAREQYLQALDTLYRTSTELERLLSSTAAKEPS